MILRKSPPKCGENHIYKNFFRSSQLSLQIEVSLLNSNQLISLRTVTSLNKEARLPKFHFS